MPQLFMHIKGGRMIYKYTSLVVGGRGPDTWDKEITLEGEELTIMEALEKIESDLKHDGIVVSIEQDDY